ncbi:hypothetical protein FALBO_5253 [Fusarium albosuccineum]|uniref:Uncharacterized protein n=1 Tax=Fusarium albosuccineum TaxID=1237068 RepID=A0A8H4PFN1_9HYPO|nr:hypothetical protein FALBO_5253 [Fusarium albosuccineum]
MPSATNATASSPRAACSTDTRQTTVTQTHSTPTPENSTEESDGMLPRFIYDATSLQDRLIQIQEPIPDISTHFSAAAATTTTIDAVPSPHPHDGHEPKGIPNNTSQDKKEEKMTGKKL